MTLSSHHDTNNSDFETALEETGGRIALCQRVSAEMGTERKQHTEEITRLNIINDRLSRELESGTLLLVVNCRVPLPAPPAQW